MRRGSAAPSSSRRPARPITTGFSTRGREQSGAMGVKPASAARQKENRRGRGKRRSPPQYHDPGVPRGERLLLHFPHGAGPALRLSGVGLRSGHREKVFRRSGTIPKSSEISVTSADTKGNAAAASSSGYAAAAGRGPTRRPGITSPRSRSVSTNRQRVRDNPFICENIILVRRTCGPYRQTTIKPYTGGFPDHGEAVLPRWPPVSASARLRSSTGSGG